MRRSKSPEVTIIMHAVIGPSPLTVARCAPPLLARCAPPLLSLSDYTSAQGIYRLRDAAYKGFTSAGDVGTLPGVKLPDNLPSFGDLNTVSGELLDLLSAITLQLRIAGTSLLVVSALLGVLAGFIFGDRSQPTEVARELKDADTFRTELSSGAAEAWDRGETDLKAIGTSKNSRFARAEAARDAEKARSTIFSEASRTLARPITAGLWLELVFCVLIDAFGNASLFVPGYGELTDVVGASVSAFLVNLIFEWPALAALVFWEEALPLTDILPTCTLGWTVVVLGLRPWIRARRGLPPRDEKEKPPVADLQSYGPTAEYLRPGGTPWKS